MGGFPAPRAQYRSLVPGRPENQSAVSIRTACHPHIFRWACRSASASSRLSRQGPASLESVLHHARYFGGPSLFVVPQAERRHAAARTRKRLVANYLSSSSSSPPPRIPPIPLAIPSAAPPSTLTALPPTLAVTFPTTFTPTL